MMRTTIAIGQGSTAKVLRFAMNETIFLAAVSAEMMNGIGYGLLAVIAVAI